MAAEEPRCVMTTTAKLYDTYGIGSVQPDGSVVLFPHETAYSTDKAYLSFASYIKSVAAGGEERVDPIALLHHQRDTGVVLALVTTRLAEIDSKFFKYHEVRMKAESDNLYARIESVMSKAVLPPRGAAIVAPHAHAQGAVESPSRMVIASSRPAQAEEPRRDPAARKPMNIITQNQGNAAQDTLEATLKQMTMAMGVRPGHDGGGLKAPIVLTARKTGAKVLDLNTPTDDELTERDAMALSGGGSPQAEPTRTQVETHRIAMPNRPEADDFDALVLEGIDDAPTNPEVREAAAPTVLPEVKPITVVSGSEAEHLGAATAVLSEDAKQALRYQRHEQAAVDEAGEVVNELFLDRSRNGAENGALANEVANDTQHVTHGGRNVQKTGINGAGRGGQRPKTERDKARGR